MLRTLALAAAISLAAVPAASAQTPSSTDSKNAAKFCKSLRTASGSADNFRSAIDAVVSGKVTTKNAYGKCVSHYAKDEAKERKAAKSSANAACKAERDAADTPEEKQAFADKYGAKNVNSAFGKCVSSAAKAKKADADEADAKRVNAAKECRKPETRAKYSSFGKCVSATAKAKQES
jgi:hypothetical protein